MANSTRLAFAALTSASLSACGAASGTDPGDAFANLAAFNSFAAPPLPPGKKAAIDVNCPVVQVSEGAAAYRVYAGSDQSPGNVRYQFALGDVARECSVEGDTLAIRVGVSGYVQVGPAGSAGSFTAPLTIRVVKATDLKLVATRTLRVAAAVPVGGAQGAFSVVTDPPLTAPFLQADADSDYSIFVSLAQGAAERPAKAAKKRRR